eukprot:gene21399-25727_t
MEFCDPSADLQDAQDLAAAGKPLAKQLYRQGKISAFAADQYPPGHRATLTSRWMMSSEPFDALYEEGYEPYVLVSRILVPLYDARFQGYALLTPRERAHS